MHVQNNERKQLRYAAANDKHSIQTPDVGQAQTERSRVYHVSRHHPPYNLEQ